MPVATMIAMRTHVIVFPFDNFGNAGTGAGAQLLGDALREVQTDTAEETRQIRASCYAEGLRFKDTHFETLDELAAWRTTGRTIAKKALSSREFLIWLGGNHLSVLPLLEELPSDTLVIQFDAHLDVYNLHDCTPELSHGNFLLHAEKRPRIVNIGSRDLFLTAKHVGKTFEAIFGVDRIAGDFPGMLSTLQQLLDSAPKIWIDLDVDAIDPQFVPAVCQPMPFGLTPPQFLVILQKIWSEKILGISISEFTPGRDVRDASLNFLGWLLEWLLLKRFEKEPPR
jgi:agmatinase